jgi:predicted permease
VSQARRTDSARGTLAILDAIKLELRDACRGLRRARAFSATVVVTLTLGIGANATMFTVVDRLMFRPLSYLRDPDSVHRIYWQWQERGDFRTTTSAPYARYVDVQRGTSSFSQAAAFFETQMAVGTGADAREQRVSAVSAAYFDFFDAQPLFGRFFTRGEDVIPRGADVAVLSHAFWQSAFGGRDVRGEILQVGNIQAAIIGVAPAGFDGVGDANPPAVYVPVTTFAASTGTDDSRTYFNRYHWGWVNVMVRRKAGITRAQAEADATQAFRATWDVARADNPESPSLADARPRAIVASLRPGRGPNPSLEARTALWLTVVSAVVLVIASVNVMNLFYARALQRSREVAVRRALGVTRWRLIARSLVETLVLAACGGGGALIVARWGSAVLGAMLVSPVASTEVVGDLRTVSFTFALSLALGLAMGLVPLHRSAGCDLVQTLRGGARGGHAGRLQPRAALLVLQAALSLVLLIGAVLFARSLNAVVRSPMGYDAERVLLVNRIIRGPVFDDEAQRALRTLLLRTAQRLPGVESAAWISSAPFASTSSTTLFVDGMTSIDSFGTFSFQATTPDYFRTMGTRILRGRGLTADDRAGAPPVAVVSAGMARVLWGQDEAIGKCFRMREPSAPCITVVGIAEDIVQRDIADARRYHYYLSMDQYTRTWGNGLVLRLRGSPARQGETIRLMLQQVMPGEAYLRVQPLADLVHTAQRSWRLGATVFVAFAALALVVAAVGLYGMIRYDVLQRRHELGVRVALGAKRADVLRLIVGEGAKIASIGLLLGIPLAMLSARWIQPLLFEQSAIDPGVYAGVSILMMLVSLGASAGPALSAARADPNDALRAE